MAEPPNIHRDDSSDPRDLPRADDGDDPEAVIECWCGARGTADELFDCAVYENGSCGGSGVLHCECGGDLCVCHNHGELECPGCEDCRGEGWDDDFWEEEQWDDTDYDDDE